MDLESGWDLDGLRKEYLLYKRIIKSYIKLDTED